MTPAAGGRPASALRRVNQFFTRRWAAMGALLGPPLAWLVVLYIGSLVLLVATAFFSVDPGSHRPATPLTLDNVRQAVTRWEFLKTLAQSAGVAVVVTLVSMCIAVPVGFFTGRVVPRRFRRVLVVAFLMPLWAGYLVKAYAWKTILRPSAKFGAVKSGGLVESTLGWTPGYGWIAVVLSLTYLWLPYMILPVYAGVERLPTSLLEASGDLGAKPWRTFTSVVTPSLVPALAAGSIFTFSLSLGDYIIPKVVSEGRVQMLGNQIERTLLTPNQPLAAAITLWPLVIIVGFLFAVRRLGGMDDS